MSVPHTGQARLAQSHERDPPIWITEPAPPQCVCVYIYMYVCMFVCTYNAWPDGRDTVHDSRNDVDPKLGTLGRPRQNRSPLQPRLPWRHDISRQ